MIIYNKLVRDKIPDIIRKDNKECKTEILDDGRYVIELKKKFLEEMEEYQGARSDEEAIEELADILEILHALAEVHGSDIDSLEQVRREKAEKRGGFSDKVFLIGVKE